MKFLDDIPDSSNADSLYAGDLLNNRKQYGESLIKFIEKVEDGCVLAIDAKWGEGKTTFANWWMADLKKREYKTIYFDAFEHDFNAEPFWSIVKALFDQFPDEFEDTSEKIMAAIVNLRDTIIPSILSFAAFSSAMVAFSSGDVKNGIVSFGSQVAAGFVKEYLKKKDSKEPRSMHDAIKDFRNALEMITTELYQSDNKKLVFIIDELDRCRPNYAVEVIEKLKHFLSVSGIVWVLMINKNQLEQSIQNVYGTIDSHQYLSKFINVMTALPKETLLERLVENQNVYSHYELLCNSFVSKYRDLSTFLEQLMPHLLGYYNMSIRDAKKVFMNVEILIEKRGNPSESYLFLSVFLSVIKVFSNEIYNKIKHRTIGPLEISKEFDFIKEFNLSDVFKYITIYLQFAMCKDSLEAGNMIDQILQYNGGTNFNELSIEDLKRICSSRNHYLKELHRQLDAICNKLDIFNIQ